MDEPCLVVAASGDEARDEAIRILLDGGATGVEVAPSLLFADPATASTQEIHAARASFQAAGLPVVAMQALLFNRPQLKLFGSPAQRESLLQHLHTMAQLAAGLGATVLVFGSPKNRNINTNQEEIAVAYFSEIGKYAAEKNTVFAIEPNPVIYGTNFINTTNEALDFVKACNVEGLKVNFDLGTVIYNEESLAFLENNLKWINHIHISEPYLETIQKRSLHNELASILRKEKYDNYISIEMKSGSEIEKIKDIIEYTQDVFKN